MDSSYIGVASWAPFPVPLLLKASGKEGYIRKIVSDKAAVVAVTHEGVKGDDRWTLFNGCHSGVFR